MSKKFRNNLSMLVMIAVLVTSSVFSFTGKAGAEEPLFTKGESNVDNQEFNHIRNSLKKTEEYQLYKTTSKINSISTDQIVINTVEGTKGKIAYIEFIFGKFTSKSNGLAYVQFTYDTKAEKVISHQDLFAQKVDDENINLKMLYHFNHNQKEIYDVTIDKDGLLFDKDGLEISQEDFLSNGQLNIKSLTTPNGQDEIGALGFCEYAVAGLCGTGGGVACYGVAAALGITTGLGGLGLAAVCSLIGSLGCAAASDQICG
ncbi:halocin C8 precursor-like protein [Rossellomorea vietnamensis]|uniref:Halocin C8-like protein n=1 Tax=Rossellomorea vietnamensis TaxID=218284 RepID=A0ACD4CC78_9BACI|nr:halocin C8 precursor-like protein [Rossellomorea vietnamensis]UXH46118.1 halocin C8 precursor-like protein [Rossellomorea vietnamensis]